MMMTRRMISLLTKPNSVAVHISAMAIIIIIPFSCRSDLRSLSEGKNQGERDLNFGVCSGGGDGGGG